MDPITIQCGKIKLEGVESLAAKPAMFYMHGWCCDWSSFVPQLEAFGPKHRTIALNMRGHGSSGWPGRGPCSVRTLADDMATAIGGLGLGRPVVIAHSMGGVVAMDMLRRHTNLARGLVLLHPMPFRHTSESRALFKSVVRQLEDDALELATRQGLIEGVMFQKTSRPELVTHMRAQMLETPAEVALTMWKAMTNYSAKGKGKVEVPTLLLSGAQPANDDAVLMDLFANLDKRSLETGSFVQLEKPEEVNGLIKTFMSALPS